SENNSPIPRDRVFMTYNHFQNAIPYYGNPNQIINVDRYMPGIEKTFWNGMASLELRTPICSTQTTNLDLVDENNLIDGVFGNMTIAAKFLLWQDEVLAMAVGTGINLPTAPNGQFFTNGVYQFTVRNQA